ncbi:MAG: hypothetical protein KC413_08735, partial [Anaerolineales bacterium]|nr:hypothetical protein [Anaerolineales bacterium]
ILTAPSVLVSVFSAGAASVVATSAAVSVVELVCELQPTDATNSNNAIIVITNHAFLDLISCFPPNIDLLVKCVFLL